MYNAVSLQNTLKEVMAMISFASGQVPSTSYAQISSTPMKNLPWCYDDSQERASTFEHRLQE